MKVSDKVFEMVFIVLENYKRSQNEFSLLVWINSNIVLNDVDTSNS